MAVYNIGQIQQMLRDAGWPENEILTMSAVVMGESSGDENAKNLSSREQSYGLLQVNRNAWPQYSISDLEDGPTNLQIALKIYYIQGKRAWGAYTDGGYKRYLNAAKAVYSGIVDSDTVGNVVDTLGNVANDNSNTIIIVAAAALLGYVLLSRG